MNKMMRVISLMLLSVVVCSGCWDDDDDTVVVMINSKADLLSFRDAINDGNSDYFAILMTDVDLEGEEWEPIGISEDYPYTGVFNANGYTIKNLTIDTDADYQGLFGYLYGGYISNLTLENPSVKGGGYVGGICGRVSTEGYIFKSCVTGGSVEGSGNYVGAVVGYASYSPVEECYNSASVSGEKGFVGGVVGYSSSSSVSDCYNLGEVSSTESNLGGVVGYAYGSNVIACYNKGEVKETTSGGGAYKVGGVAGRVSSTIIACYNLAEVEGSGDVGGVVGYVSNFYPDNFPTYVISCYNTGAVTSVDTEAGAVVGTTDPATTVDFSGCYFLTGGATYGVGDDTSAEGVSEIATLAELNVSSVVTDMNNEILSDETLEITFRYKVGESTPELYEEE